MSPCGVPVVLHKVSPSFYFDTIAERNDSDTLWSITCTATQVLLLSETKTLIY